MLYPYLNERKLTVSREDVITLFSEEAPFTKNFSEGIRDTLDELSMLQFTLLVLIVSMKNIQLFISFIICPFPLFVVVVVVHLFNHSVTLFYDFYM